MKAEELRKRAECSFCRLPVGRSGVPLFWTLTVERHALDLGAIQRHDGLAMMLQSQVLANVMGTNEELTLAVFEAERVPPEGKGDDDD